MQPVERPALRGRLGAMSVGSAVVCLLSPACGGLELPAGPELAALHAAYDDPRGTVDDESIAEVAALGLQRIDAILGLGRLDFVMESLTEVSEVVKEVARSDGDTHFRLKAVTSVERLCPGGGDREATGGAGGGAGDTHGVLTYTMRIERNGILDTVWGDFDHCQFPDPGEVFPGASELPRVAGSTITYDGTMDIYLGGDLQLADLSLQSFLFRLDGTMQVEGIDVDVDLDFRVHQDLRTEIRVPAQDGDVVFSFEPGATLVALEAGDGSYCCNFDERNCVLSEGNDCDDLQAGDRVIEW